MITEIFHRKTKKEDANDYEYEYEGESEGEYEDEKDSSKEKDAQPLLFIWNLFHTK